jgi:regulator of RNase E activity RraA
MSKLLNALKPFATCDVRTLVHSPGPVPCCSRCRQVGDALVKLKYPFGGYLDGINMWSPHRQSFNSSTSPTIIGEAVTVKMIDAEDTTSPNPPKHFIDASEPDKIMYISQPNGMYSACFGGLMATRAKVVGAAGIVIDGRFRDIAEIQGIGLPVRII